MWQTGTNAASGRVNQTQCMSDIEDGELDGCLPFTETAAAPLSRGDTPTDMSTLQDMFGAAARRSPPPPAATYGAALEQLVESSGAYFPTARPPPRPVMTRSWADTAEDTQPALYAPRVRRCYNAAIFMRLRSWRGHRWFEYLLEFRNGAYQFPQVDTEHARADEATMYLINSAGQRGMMYAPEKPEQVDSVFACQVTVDDTPHRVYRLPLHTTQGHKPERTLGIPPGMVWAAETELAVHVQLGMPAVLGKPVCPRSLKALRQLPMELQFASATPPLVLYHGTSITAAAAIAGAGFKLGGGMLGPGVYASKWDKAERFMRETADRLTRAEPGAVVRLLLFAPLSAMKVMTADDACACAACLAAGHGPKPFVDHGGVAGAAKPVTFVPDNSLPATRNAEWCIRDTSLIMVDFLLADQGSGTARVRPKRKYT